MFTHRKTLVSTLKERITLIRFKNVEMGRKWGHHAQVHKHIFSVEGNGRERKKPLEYRYGGANKKIFFN